MSERNLATVIREDGLRFVSRVPSSSFAREGMRSCLLCGQHRPRSSMVTKQILGKSQLVCEPSCKTKSSAAKG